MNIQEEMKALLGENYCKYCKELTFLKCFNCNVNYCTIECIQKDDHEHVRQFKNHPEITKLRVQALLEKTTSAINRRIEKLVKTNERSGEEKPDVLQDLEPKEETKAEVVTRPKKVLVFDMLSGTLKQKHAEA